MEQLNDIVFITETELVAPEADALQKMRIRQPLQLLYARQMVVTYIQRLQLCKFLNSLKARKVVVRQEQVSDECVGQWLRDLIELTVCESECVLPTRVNRQERRHWYFLILALLFKFLHNNFNDEPTDTAPSRRSIKI